MAQQLSEVLGLPEVGGVLMLLQLLCRWRIRSNLNVPQLDQLSERGVLPCPSLRFKQREIGAPKTQGARAPSFWGFHRILQFPQEIANNEFESGSLLRRQLGLPSSHRIKRFDWFVFEGRVGLAERTNCNISNAIRIEFLFNKFAKLRQCSLGM